MKSELLSQEKNFVTIKVTVDKADFAAALKKTYREVAARVNIPGFRKGRVPKNILDMRIGRENLKAQTFEEMIGGLLDEICSEYELSLIATPEVNIDSIPDDEDIVFTAKYEVEPEVTLPEFSEITVDLPVFEVTDAMVEDALESAKKSAATYTAVSRPAAKGDKVRMAFAMKVKDDDGNVVVSNDTAIDTFDMDPLKLNPEIYNAVLGASTGDRREASIVIPESNEDKTVAGKTAVYEIDVIEVQERVDPEMNADFFKKITPKEIATLDELKAEIRANLDARLKADARTSAENSAIAKIIEASKLDVPESMVKTQTEHLRSRYEANIKQRTKKTLEEYYAENNRDIKEFEAGLAADARRDVLGYLIVDACAKHFNINVSSEDLDVEIAAMAANYGISAESVKEMLRDRKDDFQSMISQARYRKTVDAILGAVKVNEVVKGAPVAEAPAAEAAEAVEAPAAAEAPATEE